jgi:hypothetical protein
LATLTEIGDDGSTSEELLAGLITTVAGAVSAGLELEAEPEAELAEPPEVGD